MATGESPSHSSPQQLRDENDILAASTESSLLIADDDEGNSGDDADGSEDASSGRRYQSVKKSRNNSQVNWEGRSATMIGSFSTTTLIGLVLLLAMMALTVVSICLQRYSTNKYVDIIVPAHNSTNGTVDNNPAIIL